MQTETMTQTTAASPGPNAASALPAWAASLPDDIRALVAKKKWPDIAAALRSYQHVERRLGELKRKALVEVPAEDADPAAWSALFDKLGRPARPDDYDLAGMEAGEAEETPAMTAFRQLAHDIGLSATQVSALSGWWQGLVEDCRALHEDDADADAAAAAVSVEEVLRQHWGADYERRRAMAERAYMQFADPRVGIGDRGLAALEELSDAAAVMDMLADIGQAMSEDVRVGGEGTVDFGLSQDDARSQLSQLKRDKAFMDAYLDKRHQDHDRAVQRARALNRIAAGVDPHG